MLRRVGHPDFIAAWTAQRVAQEQKLSEHIPKRCAWLLLALCASLHASHTGGAGPAFTCTCRPLGFMGRRISCHFSQKPAVCLAAPCSPQLRCGLASATCGTQILRKRPSLRSASNLQLGMPCWKSAACAARPSRGRPVP